MSILIVGQNPSSIQAGIKRKKNDTMSKLARWCEETNLDAFDFVNCSDQRGEKYTIDYERLKMKAHDRTGIIALGNVASHALKKIGVDHLKMPHPSPRNRQFNDKSFEPKMVNRMRDYLSVINKSYEKD